MEDNSLMEHLFCISIQLINWKKLLSTRKFPFGTSTPAHYTSSEQLSKIIGLLSFHSAITLAHYHVAPRILFKLAFTKLGLEDFMSARFPSMRDSFV